jgi:tRNA1(Val) A37 N6-methylase TrmN6
LGGRVRYEQPTEGHRSGIEPVFLAASIPARPGERVLEAGTGAGAALLCLAHRVPGVVGVGVEREPALAALAAANFAANGFSNLQAQALALEDYRPDAVFDHAMANPPWHETSGTASPDAAREGARRAAPDLLARWLSRLAVSLRHRGTLTFVAPAASLPHWLAALPAAGCGSPAVLPLWSRPGVPAKLLLLHAVRGGRAPARLLAGLVLHAADGAFTAEAQAVLRDAGRLAW